MAGHFASIDHITLRARVVEWSLVSIGYLHMECWIPLTEPPLKYIIGDVASNIEALNGETGATDLVASTMQALALLGLEVDVVAACVLTMETSLGTTFVEQAHASGAMISRTHPTLEQVQLLARMTVHNCRALFSPGRYETQLLKLNTLLEKLDYQFQNAHRTDARNQYAKMLIAQVKSTRPVGGPTDHAIRRSIFKYHSTIFGQLTPEFSISDLNIGFLINSCICSQLEIPRVRNFG